MLKPIDAFLNRVTMYRLLVYYLGGLLAIAIGLSAVGILPYDPFTILFNIGFLIAVCGITNALFSRAFNVPPNVESSYISALILALIMTPTRWGHDLMFLFWAAVLAMGSKYILAINHKHVFNPVAIAVAIVALTLNQGASWWVGTAIMLPFVAIGGLLIVRKIRRAEMVATFLIAAIASISALSFLAGSQPLLALQHAFLESPLIFLAAVFVTEPLTTPPTRPLQMVYGAIVGALFAPQIHIGSFYTTPELAIVIGNIFSFIVSPKARLMLYLKEKIQIAPDIYDFVFEPQRRLAFAPGQYMEWTLGHPDPDNRGNRRYFTIASAPTEREVRMGVKFYPNSSSYKQSMLAMRPGSPILAAQLAGDFTLPRDPAQKVVMIAGGIGITPFRSMIKHLVDTHQRRSVRLIYAARRVNEFVYRDVLEDAARQIGLKTYYTLTDTKRLPPDWRGLAGHIDSRLIRRMIPDYAECLFYISGPNVMVNEVKGALLEAGVPRDRIHLDYFPGLA
jgi:ferredoxin-NADP reductase